ncbi:MAG: hypothetical protein LKM37_04785 [Bacteroidales bacterium]|jgi:hypothetical protein|nr:hypothetical protein [Bacteroidales bacterium]MCI1733825.1 hypothetical protein [Bacteroidales bacterium]
MKVILISVVIVALCVFGLCINIIFKKNGEFPDGEISHNKELRKRGVVCMKEEDEAIWGDASGKKKSGAHKIKNAMDEECSGCTSADCALKKLIK